MGNLRSKTRVGAEVSAELWRNGKLVTDEEMEKKLIERGIRKPGRKKVLVKKIPNGVVAIELKPISRGTEKWK